MKARIKWVEDVMFVGESGSGHTVVIDGPPDHGGRNLGIRPMELMLQGLGGCTAFDVMLILNKSITGASCKLSMPLILFSKNKSIYSEFTIN